MEGMKFRRQEPIGSYIVDFVCFEKRLIVELDGGQHQQQISGDKQRDAWFASQGFRVLRFWNNEVLTNIDGVLTQIFQICYESPSPQPSPIKGEEVKSETSFNQGRKEEGFRA
jgi:very-short-patch-repair endonuclease